MTYIPSSSSSGDLGRYHSSKPSFLNYNPAIAYIGFYSGKGWLEERAAPIQGNANQDPLSWVVHFDNIKTAATATYPAGCLEAGTYSANLKFHYQHSTEDMISHFSFPTFSGAAGLTVTTNIEDSSSQYSTGSSLPFAPTTENSSYEQGGVFHNTLNLKFIFTCDDKLDGIYTYLMSGTGNANYSAANNKTYYAPNGTNYNVWYGLPFAGAETEIIRLA